MREQRRREPMEKVDDDLMETKSDGEENSYHKIQNRFEETFGAKSPVFGAGFTDLGA